jgi:hypothetical protein
MAAVTRDKVCSVRSSKIDGRWIVAGVVAGFFITVHTLGMRTDYVTAWARVGVNHVSPSFADMRVVTTACQTCRLGLDPLVSNPFDPWHRPLNYPRIWLALCGLGLRPEHTAALAMAAAAGFYAAVLFLVGRITVPQGFIYGALLCSPPAMWAIERGNVDLFIFTLLVVAASLLQRTAGVYCYFLITAAAILKMYPAWGFVVGLQERRRRGLVLLVLGVAAFALYAYCIRTDISLNVRSSPQIRWMSYGARVLFQQLVAMKVAVPIELYSKLAIVGSALAAAIAWWLIKRPAFSSRAGTMAAIGAGIYVGTFVMLNNFHYRLIFLLFLLPQLFEWAASRDSSRWIGAVGIVPVAGAMFLASSNHPTFLILKEIPNWLVFIICLFILMCLGTDAKLALMRSRLSDADEADGAEYPRPAGKAIRATDILR